MELAGAVQDRASPRPSALQSGLDTAGNCHGSGWFEMEIRLILAMERRW